MSSKNNTLNNNSKIYNNILACVTQQKTCERLIRKAHEISQKNDAKLHVLHVAKNSWSFLDNSDEGQALEYLFSITKSVGANMSVLKSDDITDSIVDYAKNNNVDYIVMGSSSDDHKENNFYKELSSRLKDVTIEVI